MPLYGAPFVYFAAEEEMRIVTNGRIMMSNCIANILPFISRSIEAVTKFPGARKGFACFAAKTCRIVSL